MGSPGGEAAAAAAAAVAAAARAPALLAAQVWSARHFVRFTKSSSGRSHRERPPLGARPRRRRRPQRQAGPRGPAAGTQGPGTAVFAGEGLSPPRPRAPLEPRAGERRNGLRRGQEPGAPGAERGGRGGAGCGGRGGSAAREPEAETHRRERRERPAIVPVSVRPGRGPARLGSARPDPALAPEACSRARAEAGRPGGRAEGGTCHFRRRRRGPGAGRRGREPGEGRVPEERRARAEGKLRRVEAGPGGWRKRQTLTGRPGGGRRVSSSSSSSSSSSPSSSLVPPLGPHQCANRWGSWQGQCTG